MPISQPGQGAKATVSRPGGRGGRPSLAAPGWAITGLICLALAGVLTAIVASAPSWVHPLDSQWLRWMLDIRTPWATSAAKVLNVVAGGTVMWIVRGMIAVALAFWRRWRALAVFAAAEACAELSIGPVKALVNRPRPPHPLVAVTGQSLPSGHALAAAVTAAALALILTHPGRYRVLALAAAGTWTAIVGLSRTYLSAHWLTDVLAGILIGAGWATLWFGILGPRQVTAAQATVPPAPDPGAPARRNEASPRGRKFGLPGKSSSIEDQQARARP